MKPPHQRVSLSGWATITAALRRAMDEHTPHCSPGCAGPLALPSRVWGMNVLRPGPGAARTNSFAERHVHVRAL
jgi:hypothetical protein